MSETLDTNPDVGEQPVLFQPFVHLGFKRQAVSVDVVAQDLCAWLVSVERGLGGFDDDVEEMLRFLIGQCARRPDVTPRETKAQFDYPEAGLYHPDLAGHHITTDAAGFSGSTGETANVSVLMLRSCLQRQ